MFFADGHSSTIHTTFLSAVVISGFVDYTHHKFSTTNYIDDDKAKKKINDVRHPSIIDPAEQ